MRCLAGATSVFLLPRSIRAQIAPLCLNALASVGVSFRGGRGLLHIAAVLFELLLLPYVERARAMSCFSSFFIFGAGGIHFVPVTGACRFVVAESRLVQIDPWRCIRRTALFIMKHLVKMAVDILPLYFDLHGPRNKTRF